MSSMKRPAVVDSTDDGSTTTKKQKTSVTGGDDENSVSQLQTDLSTPAADQPSQSGAHLSESNLSGVMDNASMIDPPVIDQLEDAFPKPFEGDPNGEEEYDANMCSARPPVYLKELELCQLLGQLREKPEWWLKVNQPLIVNRWKRQIYEQSDLLTPVTIEYGIQELKYQGQLYQQSQVRGHSILPSAIDGVYQNDQLISTDLLQQLKECLKPFEDVPESERDYHPGSDHQVIDLVHPSLYCLRIGRTKLTKEPIQLKDTLRRIGSGVVISEPPKDLTFRYATSKKYAWLPSEFEVSPDGSKVKINSYINNIHPVQHQQLYGVLEEVFASFIPLFERVLTDLRAPSGSTTRMMDEMHYGEYNSSPSHPSPEVVQGHLDRERASLSIASNGRAKFYLDVAQKVPVGLQYEQYQATVDVGRLFNPRMRLSAGAQRVLFQYQNRLAHLYLESTFEALIKTSGPSTIPQSQSPSTDRPLHSQLPYVGLYLPSHILTSMPQLIELSSAAMTKAVEQCVDGDPCGGLLFTQQMATGWLNEFKIRLPQLYPQLEQVALDHYVQLFLKPEYFNLLRLASVIEYWTGELIDGSNKAAQTQKNRIRRRGIKYVFVDIDCFHVGIHSDAELFNFNVHYPFDQPTFEDDILVNQDESDVVNQTNVTPSSSSSSSSTAQIAAAVVNDTTQQQPTRTTMMDAAPAATTHVAPPVGTTVSIPSQPAPPPSIDFYHMDADDEDEKNSGGEDAEEEEDEDEVPIRYYRDTKEIEQVEVNFPFTPESRQPQSVYGSVSLSGRTLQVIVKLVNIELTPEKPEYSGEGWQVDGMKNESIVASGIYYIDSTNITESRLSFRHAVYDFEPDPEDADGLRASYGLKRHMPASQIIGSVGTRSGRAIIYPNIYLRCVLPFQLADPTKPGKQQMLVFHLVDPTIRVTSTANVPPQQRHWLKTATGENTPTILAEIDAGTSLIPDLINLAAEYHSDWGVIDPSKAVRVRAALMKERKIFGKKNGAAVYNRPIIFNDY